MKRTNTEHGDETVALANEILRCEAGSGVHGIALEGTDDHDEMGVFIEPPSSVFGPREHRSYVWRSQPEGARSGPGDTDLVMYSLRHYVELVAKGNPSALVPLFAPNDRAIFLSPLGVALRRDLPALVLSKRAVWRCLGYMHGQRDRLTGVGPRRGMPKRPELVEAHGFDTKYAGHAVRLAMQANELALHGRITLPMRASQREEILAVRRGEVPLGAILVRLVHLECLVELAMESTRLPDEPRTDELTRWVADAHRRHWGWAGVDSRSRRVGAR